MLGRGIIIDGNVISATGGGEGGTDNYNLLQNKPSINGITLIGDKSFSDLGLETTKTYTELTDYVDDYYFNIQIPTRIGDNVPQLTELTNSKYMVLKVSDLPSNKFRITGKSNSVCWFTSSINPLVEGSYITSLAPYDYEYTNTEVAIDVPENANYIIFNFTDTDEVTPKVEVISETIGGTSNYNNLTNKPSINGVELIGNKSWEDLGLPTITDYIELTDYEVGYQFDITIPPYRIGSGVPLPVANNNSQYIILKISDLPSTKFRISGYSEKVLYFTCTDNPIGNISLIKSLSAQEYGYENQEINIEVPAGANYLVFNFTNTNEYTPKLEVISQTLTPNNVIPLTQDLIIESTSELTLDTGLYNTSAYKVYLGSSTSDNLICGSNSIFYFDKSTQELISSFESLYFENGEWIRLQNEYIENELSNNRNKIPTSKAVYEALQNIEPSNLFYTKLTEEYFCNSNGTITNRNGDVLSSGYYFNSYGLHYDNNYDLNFANTIFYYDSQRGYIIRSFNSDYTNLKYYLYYRDTSQAWELHDIDTNSTIPASGDNSNIPTNNAVRNYVNGKLSRYANFQISADTNLVTTADWRSKTVPLELITNNIQDLISYNSSTNIFTVLKNCKLKVELNSGLNFTTGTSGNPYFAVLRIKKTNGNVTTYISSSILLFGDIANNNSLINELQLNGGDTFSYEINFGTAGTYRLLGGRTYVIFTEM